MHTILELLLESWKKDFLEQVCIDASAGQMIHEKIISPMVTVVPCEEWWFSWADSRGGKDPQGGKEKGLTFEAPEEAAMPVIGEGDLFGGGGGGVGS